MLRAPVRRVCTRHAPTRLVPRRPYAEASPSPRQKDPLSPHPSPSLGHAHSMKPPNRSSSVLETLLHTSSSEKKMFRTSYLTPPPPKLRDRVIDEPTVAWAQQEADLIRVLEEVKTEARREREAEQERIRIQEAIQSGARLGPKSLPKWHLTRVGPRPGLSDYVAVAAVALPLRGRGAAQAAAKAPSAQPPQQYQSQQAHGQRAGAQAPSAWDTAGNEDDEEEAVAAEGQSSSPLSRARQLLAVVRGDVANLFTFVTASKLRRMLAIESAHLAWIRFLLALLALLLIVPDDSTVAPTPETQRMLRLILLALLLMHTQQLILRFSALNMQRRPMHFSSMASAASFALLWLMAVLLLPYSPPRSAANSANAAANVSNATALASPIIASSSASIPVPSSAGSPPH